MGQRNAKDNTANLGSAFTVTNSEVVTSLDADTATLTSVSNALAAVIDALQKQGIMRGSVS